MRRTSCQRYQTRGPDPRSEPVRDGDASASGACRVAPVLSGDLELHAEGGPEGLGRDDLVEGAGGHDRAVVEQQRVGEAAGISSTWWVTMTMAGAPSDCA